MFSIPKMVKLVQGDADGINHMQRGDKWAVRVDWILSMVPHTRQNLNKSVFRLRVWTTESSSIV